jgi:2-haloacid dehalogenase
MLDFSRFEVLTFDCYGTLIDWESGILAAVHRVLRGHSVQANDSDILKKYAELESAAEAGPYRRYREILTEVMNGLASHFGAHITDAEAASLPESIHDWQPFPDSVAALAQLGTRYKLAVISNIDDDLFAHSAQRLGNPFTHVITAQQVGSYKPSHRNFHTALAQIGVDKEKVLHCAQSIFHDIVPARELGIANVWVNRRQLKQGSGATKHASATPDLEVPDLRTLAELVLDSHHARSVMF